MNTNNAQGIITNYSLIIILSLCVVVGLIYWAITIIRKNPDITLGHLINAMFLKQKLSIIIITVIALNISEAIMAASITPIGETPINPLARIMSHGMIALVAILCGLQLPTAFRDILNKEKRIGVSIFIFILTLFGTFALPYANVFLIASGLKQIQLVNLYTLGLNPFNDMGAYYVSIGLPAYFSPVQAMEYPMVVSVIVYFAHVFLVVLDGAFIIHNKDKKKDKNEKSSDDKKEDKKSDNLSGTNDPIYQILKMYANNSMSEEELNKIKDRSHDIMDGLNEPNKSRLNSKIQSFATKVKNFIHSSNKNAEERAAAKKELRQDIKEFWKSSTSGGRGFGLTLPTLKIDKDDLND